MVWFDGVYTSEILINTLTVCINSNKKYISKTLLCKTESNEQVCRHKILSNAWAYQEMYQALENKKPLP